MFYLKVLCMFPGAKATKAKQEKHIKHANHIELVRVEEDALHLQCLH